MERRLYRRRCGRETGHLFTVHGDPWSKLEMRVGEPGRFVGGFRLGPCTGCGANPSQDDTKAAAKSMDADPDLVTPLRRVP